ncbi:MAG: hypothetical protein M3Z04_23760 [Chloroflexota bacterium]|nr:hypothetical protein [Chloroflexota bacterium]
MKSPFTELIRYITLTVILATFVILFIVNPIWSQYEPLFGIPKVIPPVSAPVDGAFYLRNAELGYQWKNQDPLSLWFHPLLAYLLMLTPKLVPLNISFWIISITFGVGSLLFIGPLIRILTHTIIHSNLLPLILLAPGALGLATGNAEIPTLFFTSALLFTILCKSHSMLTVICGTLAIWTKPNALYMYLLKKGGRIKPGLT